VHGPPPPPPNLDPPDLPRVVRTVEEVLGNDAPHWMAHHERLVHDARATLDDFGEALAEDVTERRKIEEELTEATRRPPGAGQPGPGSREARRRPRAQRHR